MEAAEVATITTAAHNDDREPNNDRSRGVLNSVKPIWIVALSLSPVPCVCASHRQHNTERT